MQRIQLNESLVGTVIAGDFTIHEYLGSGAMGTTYRARQDSLGRDVCIKFLALSSLSEPENVQRFKREAKVLARLKHRNIVECFSFGIFQSVYPYLILELVEGQSLRSYLEKGPLDWTETSRLMVQACDALQYAHDQGFAHRDVKPDNMMLCGESGSQQLKLIDFGLACKLNCEPGFDTLTTPGATLGTPNYMPPEAFSGEHGPLGDIYALGCVLHECISAQRPFAADNPLAVMRHQVTEYLPPLPAEVKPAAVRTSLDRIIRRATEKEKAARFQSCKEMSAILRDLTGESPALSEVVPPAAAPAPRPAASAGLVLTVAGIFLLTGILGYVVCVVPTRKTVRVPVQTSGGTVFAQILAQMPPERASYAVSSLNQIEKELQGLAAGARGITARWKQSASPHETNALNQETEDFCSKMESFLFTTGQFLDQQPQSLPKLKQLCLEVGELINVSFAKSRSQNLFWHLLACQCDLLVSAGYYQSAASIVRSGHPLTAASEFAGNSLDDLIDLHRIVAEMHSGARGQWSPARLRPAVWKYKKLNRGRNYFGEFLPWYSQSCAAVIARDNYRLSLFAIANSIEFSNRPAVATALIDIINVEISMKRFDVARLALNVLLANFKPDQLNINLVARQLANCGWLDRAELLLDEGLKHAAASGDAAGWCKLESLRLALLADILPDTVGDFRKLMQSRNWHQCKSQPAVISAVLVDLREASTRCRRAKKNEDGIRLLETCQDLLLESRSTLLSESAEKSALVICAGQMYQVLQCFSAQDAYRESLPLRAAFLELVDRHKSQFPDGFFPFTARMEMARALWLCGRHDAAKLLFAQCEHDSASLFKTCAVGGWKHWLSGRLGWLRDAGFVRCADQLEARLSNDMHVGRDWGSSG